ncbi:hypothetical protein AEYBE204_18710 [Asticcacaulis sp. YBE204]|nr:hypothetical protein AEYBE204_18710 [Asticcacaulis sp. YBE204]
MIQVLLFVSCRTYGIGQFRHEASMSIGEAKSRPDLSRNPRRLFGAFTGDNVGFVLAAKLNRFCAPVCRATGCGGFIFYDHVSSPYAATGREDSHVSMSESFQRVQPGERETGLGKAISSDLAQRQIEMRETPKRSATCLSQIDTW